MKRKLVGNDLKVFGRQYVRDVVLRKNIEVGRCVICGTKKVEAHHFDYMKPLSVIWVCRKHHREFDFGKRKVSNEQITKLPNIKKVKKAHLVYLRDKVSEMKSVIWLDAQLLQKVKIESAKKGISMAEFVSMAIRQFIKPIAK